MANSNLNISSPLIYENKKEKEINSESKTKIYTIYFTTILVMFLIVGLLVILLNKNKF
jgi:hypothetical protein